MSNSRLAASRRDGDDLDHDDAIFCPICTGRLTLLGVMGRVIHFRCRDCGIDSCKRTE